MKNELEPDAVAATASSRCHDGVVMITRESTRPCHTGGAQQYYGVNADVVVYGKTLGGGLANGVVCGPSRLMKRFDETRPLRVAYVIGTFSAAPLTLACMAEFLDWVSRPETRDQ